MPSSTLLAFLGAAALSSPAFAAPAAATAGAASSAMMVQTIQGQRPLLRPAEVGELVGSYDLSNGQTLRVSYAQRRLFADMGGNKAEIVPAGQGTFVSRNADMTLVFDQQPFATSVAISRK